MHSSERTRHLRLLLVYFLWIIVVLIALFLARAYDLDSFNVGWGDSAADHRHNVLWRQTVAAVVTCFGVVAVIGVISRFALYALASTAAVLTFIAFVGQHGPMIFRWAVLVLQFPGFFVAIMALGVHGGQHLTMWWMVAVNTMLYAPMIYAVANRKSW